MPNDYSLVHAAGDLLKAKCGAPIRVELVDRHGNMVMDSKYSNMEFEVGNSAGNP